jgi:hypothetical protein
MGSGWRDDDDDDPNVWMIWAIAVFFTIVAVVLYIIENGG